MQGALKGNESIERGMTEVAIVDDLGVVLVEQALQLPHRLAFVAHFEKWVVDWDWIRPVMLQPVVRRSACLC